MLNDVINLKTYYKDSHFVEFKSTDCRKILNFNELRLTHTCNSFFRQEIVNERDHALEKLIYIPF